MERVRVDSSNVAEVGYDASTGTLEIAFNNGGVYQYFGVPQSVSEELVRAHSIGKYFSQHIKGNYEFKEV